MDQEELTTSSCLLDHCYMNGEAVDQESTEEGVTQEKLTYQMCDVIDGSTFIQLEDGSIVLQSDDNVVQLEDGSIVKLENCDMVEVENSDFFNQDAETSAQTDNNSSTGMEDDYSEPNGGYYIRLGDQLLYVANEQQSDLPEGIPVMGSGGQADPSESEELKWAVIKDEAKDPENESKLYSCGAETQIPPVTLLCWSGTHDSRKAGVWSTGNTSSESSAREVKLELLDSDAKTIVQVNNSKMNLELSSQHKGAKLAQYNCKECNIQFDSRKDHLEHKKEHQKPYLCDICGQGFLHLSSFRSHKSTHDPEVSSFKCHICGRDFVSLSLIKDHLKQHHLDADNDLDKLYKCEICDAKFIYSSNLSRHRKAHSENKNHVCEVCGKGFYQKSNLRSHQQLHDLSELEPEAIATGVVGKYRRPKQFLCKVCGKGFANQSGLRNHDAIHTGIRPHACTFCDKKFALLSCLKTHISTIHSEIMHLCQVCGKGYRNANYLKLHLKIHSGKKDYRCDLCSKAFVDNPSLKLHLRTHTGEKPYNCEVCGKSFTQQAHLNTHRRIHTGEKPYDCSVCGKSFRQLSNRIEHERIHKKVVHVDLCRAD